MLAVYHCHGCEVYGRDSEPATCWQCGSTEVRVTARVQAGDNQTVTNVIITDEMQEDPRAAARA